MAKAESLTDDPNRNEISRWYDDEYDATESEHTSLDAVPETADIEYDDGTVHDGIGLSFLIERALLDPHATVGTRDES